MGLQALFAAGAALFLSQTAAHMLLQQPVPYTVDKVDKGPITAATYPCQHNLGYTISTMNEMVAGETQTVSFKGSAVHGGGSCQLSVTLDKNPTPQSKFKVIHSIMGGCPGVDGAPTTFDFVLPKEVPNGEATFAWTWFAKLSGLPEMYMNCAPISISGGASDNSAFNSLPDLFIANIGSADCTTPPNKDTEFPNPGQSVATSAGANLAPPTGAGCGSAAPQAPDNGIVTLPSNPPSNTGGIFAPVSPESPPLPSSAPASDGAGYPSPPASTPLASHAPSPIGSGGGLSPLGSTPLASHAPSPIGSGGAPSPQPSGPPAALPSSVFTTVITRTASAPTSPSTPSPVQPDSGSDGNATSSACQSTGQVVCNGSSKYGLCNYGSVVWQSVAPGTECRNGSIVSIVSRSHAKRRRLARRHH